MGFLPDMGDCINVSKILNSARLFWHAHLFFSWKEYNLYIQPFVILYPDVVTTETICPCCKLVAEVAISRINGTKYPVDWKSW